MQGAIGADLTLMAATAWLVPGSPCARAVARLTSLPTRRLEMLTVSLGRLVMPGLRLSGVPQYALPLSGVEGGAESKCSPAGSVSQTETRRAAKEFGLVTVSR